MIQFLNLINAGSIKYLALGFVLFITGEIGYKIGYDRGHTPKEEERNQENAD